jgi:phosphoesterase RecJ-like protein
LSPRLFIALDCADLERMGGAAEVFNRSQITVSIDHHASNPAFAAHNLIRPDTPSTCELIFELVDGFIPVSRDMAAAIYAGMVFDTGGFRHNSTRPESYAIAARLVQCGIDFSHIYNRLLYRRSAAGARIFGKAIEKLGFRAHGRVAYCSVSYEDIAGCGAGVSDLDGISEYTLNIDGVQAAVFLSEREPGEIKASLRSHDVDVSAVAAHFGGGGHKQAAGCNMKGTLKESAAALLPLLEKAAAE